MGFLSTAVMKDLGRLRRDPIGLATSLGIPLVLVILTSLIFGGGQATPQGRLLVTDEDGSLLSRALTSAFSQEPLSEMLVMETTPREEGRRRMDRGEASALLIVPKGFQDAFLQGQPAQLQLVTNPAQEILPNIVEETLSVVVDGGFYLQRLAAIPLRSIAAGRAAGTRSDNTNSDITIPDSTIAQVSVEFNRLGRSLSKYLDPPVIDLDLRVAAAQRENQNVAAAFLPAMLFMGLLFVANAYASDIWREQSWGTLRRLATTPAPLGAFLGARLTSLALVLFGVAVVAVTGMRWFAKVPVASVPFATIWVVLFGTAFYLLLLTIGLFTASQRSANVVGNLVVFPLALLGGSFFPFEMMPDWMASIGRFTPNGWAITQFKAFVAGSAHGKDLLVGTVWMAAVGSLLFFLALRRMRRLV